MLPPDSSSTQPVSTPSLNPNAVKRGNRTALITIIIVVLVILIVGCGGLIALAASPFGQQLARESEATETAQTEQTAQAVANRPPSTHAAPSATVTAYPFPTTQVTGSPTAEPTSTSMPSPTATPPPTISLSKPILGGSWGAFDNLFGDNNCCVDNGWQYQGKFGSTTTDVMWATWNGDDIPDDHNVRITGILTEPLGGIPWTTAQEKTMVNQFMPPDAKLMGSKKVYLGNLVEGTEYIYTSALLAHTLPASDFKDVNGKQVQAGMFYVYYDEAEGQDSLGTDENFVQTPY